MGVLHALIPTKPLRSWCYYCYFTDDESEAQRGQATSPTSHSGAEAELGLELSLFSFRVCAAQEEKQGQARKGVIGMSECLDFILRLPKRHVEALREAER